MNLSLSNVNTSQWTLTDGSEGLWLGLGYNSTAADTSSDFTLCYYNYTNSTADHFTCKGALFNQTSSQFNTSASSQIVSNVMTLLAQVPPNNSSLLGNFSVSFTRPFSEAPLLGAKAENLSFSPINVQWGSGQLDVVPVVLLSNLGFS